MQKIIAFVAVVSVSAIYATTENICKGHQDLEKIANPFDCKSFYLCFNDNVPLLITCPNNNHFNRKTGFCDAPEIAECFMEEEPTSISTTVTQPSGPICDPITVSWEPHTHLCSKYFLCFHGNPIERSCAAGLHFSPEEKKCMLPELAQCAIPQICPEVDDEFHPVFFPNSNDCTKYFLCFNGSPIPRTCADGLFWDIVDEWCTFPNEVQCDPNTPNNPQTEEPTEETTVPTIPSEPPTDETTTEAESPTEFECPSINNFPTFHPHPTECEKYFLCFRGIGHPMICADGLIFDINQSQCFPADNSTCILETTTGDLADGNYFFRNVTEKFHFTD